MFNPDYSELRNDLNDLVDLAVDEKPFRVQNLLDLAAYLELLRQCVSDLANDRIAPPLPQD